MQVWRGGGAVDRVVSGAGGQQEEGPLVVFPPDDAWGEGGVHRVGVGVHRVGEGGEGEEARVIVTPKKFTSMFVVFSVELFPVRVSAGASNCVVSVRQVPPQRRVLAADVQVFAGGGNAEH